MIRATQRYLLLMNRKIGLATWSTQPKSLEQTHQLLKLKMITIAELESLIREETALQIAHSTNPKWL
jgi:hypothetical protein